MIPAEFLREYAQKTNTHHFEEVAPLIAENAIYWFNDGSFQGKDAIKKAFEKTWALVITFCPVLVCDINTRPGWCARDGCLWMCHNFLHQKDLGNRRSTSPDVEVLVWFASLFSKNTQF